MKKVYLALILLLFPIIAHGSIASDFTVNPQSTYAVPPDTSELLILDVTLPGIGLTSIKINNAGTAQQYHVSQISVYEDGPSPGWDGDESKRAGISSSPFFDTELIGDFSKQRIFVTVDITSTAYSGVTIKPELDINSVLFSSSTLNGPTDEKIIGFERIILAGTNAPSVPFSPLAKSGEALSTSTIRWYFTDLSDNEFGFKILDSNLKEVVRSETADLSYLDEMGLQPSTEYSGRRIVAFNDRGENSVSVSSVFPSARTLVLAPVVVPPAVTSTEVVAEEQPKKEVETVSEEAAPAPTLFETIQTKIADIQKEISNLIKQLDEFIKQSAATVLGALQGFLKAFFEK